MEHWNLYLDCRYQAQPWPWPNRVFAELTDAELKALPGGCADFLRYSPADGPVDMVHVPAGMPRECPDAQTEMAVYQDADCLYVFIAASAPQCPVPGLADDSDNDFMVAIAHDDGCGLYLGVDIESQAVAKVQIWDRDRVEFEPKLSWPFALLKPWGEQREVVLEEGYQACCWEVASRHVAGFQIERRLLASCIAANRIRLSVGRRCAASCELLSWGSNIVWTPRPDAMGVLCLEDDRPAGAPTVARIDMAYDPATEQGSLRVGWDGQWRPDVLSHVKQGPYAEAAERATLALNGEEREIALGGDDEPVFDIADGWNRLELLQANCRPQAFSFQKLSGQRLVLTTGVNEAPSVDELADAFAQWHAAHEQQYQGDGIWKGQTSVACLCHCGVFHMEPYCYAYRYLSPEPEYRDRIEACCGRLVAAQEPEGWFPCMCLAPGRRARLGEGGAFANGSVGEGLALAGQLFGREDWLAASARAAGYEWYRPEVNQNYAAFVLWHLAALNRHVAAPEYLPRMRHFSRHFVCRDIGLSGAQDAHNYFSDYANITLKGMALFLEQLPADDPDHAWLRELTIRYTNQILARQQPSGMMAARNRKYLGYHIPVPGLFHVAYVLPDLASSLQPALNAMCKAVMVAVADGQKSDCKYGLTLALMARQLQNL